MVEKIFVSNDGDDSKNGTSRPEAIKSQKRTRGALQNRQSGSRSNARFEDFRASNRGAAGRRCGQSGDRAKSQQQKTIAIQPQLLRASADAPLRPGSSQNHYKMLVLAALVLNGSSVTYPHSDGGSLAHHSVPLKGTQKPRSPPVRGFFFLLRWRRSTPFLEQFSKRLARLNNRRAYLVLIFPSTMGEQEGDWPRQGSGPICHGAGIPLPLLTRAECAGCNFTVMQGRRLRSSRSSRLGGSSADAQNKPADR